MRSRYRLPMTQERLWNFASAVALVVVAATWLWFLFAYADLIFRYQRFVKIYLSIHLRPGGGGNVWARSRGSLLLPAVHDDFVLRPQ